MRLDFISKIEKYTRDLQQQPEAIRLQVEYKKVNASKSNERGNSVTEIYSASSLPVLKTGLLLKTWIY